MTNIESVPEAGLFVVRGGIDAVLAEDFLQEWTGWRNAAGLLDYSNRQGKVERSSYLADKFIRGKSATARVLNFLGVHDPRKSVFINHQAPHSKQAFHQDDEPNLISPTLVVHTGIGGIFNYSPEAQSELEAGINPDKIELDGGDVVVQTRPNLWHRGANPSDLARITAVVSSFKP